MYFSQPCNQRPCGLSYHSCCSDLEMASSASKVSWEGGSVVACSCSSAAWACCNLVAMALCHDASLRLPLGVLLVPQLVACPGLPYMRQLINEALSLSKSVPLTHVRRVRGKQGPGVYMLTHNHRRSWSLACNPTSYQHFSRTNPPVQSPQ